MKYKKKIIIHQRIEDIEDGGCERCGGELKDIPGVTANLTMFQCGECDAFETFKEDGSRLKDNNQRFS